MARIGILGGCFNPVHNGHLRLAVEARERLGLDAVELVPVHVPPHKTEGLLPFDVRAVLCEQAAAGTPGLGVNRIEGRRPGPSYTIETLEELVADRPGDAFTFIMGAGEFLALGVWRRGLALVELADLAVAARQGKDLEGRDGRDEDQARRFVREHWPAAGLPAPDGVLDPDAPGGMGQGPAWRVGAHRIRFFDLPRLDISATLVRRLFLDGRSVLGLVPAAVDRWLLANPGLARQAWSG